MEAKQESDPVESAAEPSSSESVHPEDTVEPEALRRNLDNEGESGESESDAGFPDNSRIPFPETRGARDSVLDAARSGTVVSPKESRALHGALVEALENRARGIGVEVSDQGLETQSRVDIGPSGRIVIHSPQGAADDRARKFGSHRRPFVQSMERAAQEELIHAAYFATLREEWGGHGDFVDFAHRKSVSEIQGFRDSLNKLGQDEFAYAVMGSR